MSQYIFLRTILFRGRKARFIFHSLLLLVMCVEMGEIMKPVYVAPIVAYLCHEDCTDTGGVFEVKSLFVANTLYRPLCCVSDFFFYTVHIYL